MYSKIRILPPQHSDEHEEQQLAPQAAATGEKDPLDRPKSAAGGGRGQGEALRHHHQGGPRRRAQDKVLSQLSQDSKT